MLYKLRQILFGSKLKRALSLKRKTPMKERWEDFVDYLYDLYTDLLIVPYETTRRFFYWGWKLKKNYSFDCNNTYYMIHLRLKKMIEYSEKYSSCLWNSNPNTTQMRKLRIACELAKRLNDDYYWTHKNKHEEKWGELQLHFGKPDERRCRSLDFSRPNANTDKEKEQERKEYQIASDMDDQQKKDERKYFFKLLEKHLEGWWD